VWAWREKSPELSRPRHAIYELRARGTKRPRGSFHERSAWTSPTAAQPVRPRQVWVYATAARLDDSDAYARIARRADAFHEACYRRSDGRFA
jgi:hypothetical protein